MARHFTKRQSKNTKLGLVNDCTSLYVRVSTEAQAAEGYSLDDQESRLRAYCAAQGWPVCAEHIYIDAGISGKSTERPEFQRMMAAAADGQIRRIVCMKLDRLARNVRDFLATVDQLTAYGVDLVLIKESFDTGTPHGKFALTMFAAMAELEAATIAERVTAGRMQKARQGGWNGGRTPYGYTVDTTGQWSIDDGAADVVRRIFCEFNRGASLSDIAQELNAAQIRTQRGGKWYASTVRYVLSNGFHAGLMQYAGQEPVPGEHPAIVTREAYDAAQRRLDALRPGPVAAATR